jgi:formylglycine-generating enzyme required for sulfatase activity
MIDLTFDLVTVGAGTVFRGTPAEEIDDLVSQYIEYGIPLPRSYFAKEAPRIEVRVDAFAIARVPTTIGQWRVFCDEVGWRPAEGDERLPVEVDWWQAVAFCEWATEITALPLRLPTEDEWERAARGDDTREFPWGDVFEARRANLAELGIGHALPVGSLPLGASAFGLLDMAGNVDEWTATEFYPYPGAPPDVPLIEEQALDRHVRRGGSYRQCKDLARCARRHGMYEPSDGGGFRVACTEAIAGRDDRG